jgi:CubicO group peptidase (beta-lactamase class C family)
MPECQRYFIMNISKKRAWRLAVAAIVSTLVLLAPEGHGRDRIAAGVDRLFAPWNRPDAPGAAVVIVKDGAVMLQRGYGCANLEQRTPITPKTVFDAASVAKQFTGLGVAILVEQGKISLDDDIHKYLPEVPDFGKRITVGNLLHHTSGLRDWPETLAISGLAMEDVITLETILEMVRHQRELDFAPGEEHLYSNTGYNLLAVIVAEVTGQSFHAWTEANLFRPLGMKQTHFCDNPAEVVCQRADAYAPGDKGTYRRVVSQLSALGSSSLFITAKDMGKWLVNFETAHVGGKQAIDAMHQPGQLNSGKRVDYGFGVALGEYRGTKLVIHTGGWAGYRSAVVRLPEKKLGIAVLSNAATLDAANLALKITDLYLGPKPEDKPTVSAQAPTVAVKTDPSHWDAYLGTYRLGPNWWLTITREGDRLMAQATRESKFNMTPRSDTHFFVEAYGAEVEFVREGSRPVTQLRYRGIQAPKLTVTALAPERLRAYAGDYWSDELQRVVRLEIHGGQLMTWHRSAGWIRLLPTDADRFDTEAGQGIVFSRDAALQVDEMRVSGGRVRHLRFRRVSLDMR